MCTYDLSLMWSAPVATTLYVRINPLEKSRHELRKQSLSLGLLPKFLNTFIAFTKTNICLN